MIGAAGAGEDMDGAVVGAPGRRVKPTASGTGNTEGLVPAGVPARQARAKARRVSAALR